jgi:hypothetical protein
VPRLFALVLLLVLALAGCGAATTDSATEFEGAEQDVARAVEDLEEAGQEDEPRRICQALLAKEVVQRIEDAGSECVDAVGKALDQADTFSLTVESVRVSGTTARARVETGSDEEKVEVLELVREGDAWKIAGLPGAS